jgi:ubiquitin-protein ligase
MVTPSNKRKERDIMKLMMSNYEVAMAEESNQNDFYVVFKGPKESAYEGVKYS